MSELNNDTPNTEESILETGIPTLSFTVSPSTVVYQPTDHTLSISDMPADAKATGDAIQNVSDLLSGDISDLAADIATIEETLSSLSNLFYPVGSVYVTVDTTVPARFTGTWEEIAMPMTWNDLKRGTRSWAELEGDPDRTLHFFLRTA